MFIAVVNASTRVSDGDVLTMSRAIHDQVVKDIAPAWGIRSHPVVFMGHVDPAAQPADGSINVPKHLPPRSWVLGVFDTDDQPGALAWHTEGPDGSIFGRVNAGAFLDNGGTVLEGPMTIASGLSHEIAEAVGDAPVDIWRTRPDGILVPQEMADPVENTTYDIEIEDVDGHLVKVSVSDFVTPAWFDDSPPPGVRTRFAPDGVQLAPFEIDKGGYSIEWDPTSGKSPAPVWGETYPEWRKATKASPLSRTARLIESAKTAT